MLEGHAEAVVVDFDAGGHGAAPFDVLAVGHLPSAQQQAFGHRLLLFRMDVIRLAHVDRHGHAGVRDTAPDVPLGLPHVGPDAGERRLVQRRQSGRVHVQLSVLLRTMLDESRKLDEQERQVGLLQGGAPALDQRGKQHLELGAAAAVVFTLIVQHAAEGERAKRRDDAIEPLGRHVQGALEQVFQRRRVGQGLRVHPGLGRHDRHRRDHADGHLAAQVAIAFRRRSR